ncbi:SIMPL domain-containing protein [Marinomonas ostreistagni]|uniref:SIMPL domain-containing protein n=1 Tax=Marinomonas ostreistagni TaxID=359209 RepID=UPI00194FFA20|nr:SIMPL domain-containing protein [Marinomonas ostreistagni]MBM6550133.1 SIMPL domain-containing protein [Marinomonas ostreistagni]
MNIKSAGVLGASLVVGALALGWLINGTANDLKSYERSVTVKGLAEREVQADVAIWPIQFTVASNDLEGLYAQVEDNTAKVAAFLADNQISEEAITINPPMIVDKLAQQYGNNSGAEFRYNAVQKVTVYSNKIDQVRAAQSQLSALGRQGIVLSGDSYQTRTDYLYTGLNDIKPEMIEQATQNAREVGEKFAADSNSKLGKIKRASQGQFSINDRDQNNPHIKNVRVVSTITYYLAD